MCKSVVVQVAEVNPQMKSLFSFILSNKCKISFLTEGCVELKLFRKMYPADRYTLIPIQHTHNPITTSTEEDRGV